MWSSYVLYMRHIWHIRLVAFEPSGKLWNAAARSSARNSALQILQMLATDLTTHYRSESAAEAWGRIQSFPQILVFYRLSVMSRA